MLDVSEKEILFAPQISWKIYLIFVDANIIFKAPLQCVNVTLFGRYQLVDYVTFMGFNVVVELLIGSAGKLLLRDDGFTLLTGV